MAPASTPGDDPNEIFKLLEEIKQRRKCSQLIGSPYFTDLQIEERRDSQVSRSRGRPSSHGSSESQSSIFDSSDKGSQYSYSSAPSRAGPEFPNPQRPTPPIFEQPWIETTVAGYPYPRLPCEFLWYDNCEVSFRLEEDENWVQHMLTQHMVTEDPERRLPSYLICWFCNHDFEARSDSHDDKEEVYGVRIRHIAEHFRLNKTISDIRPDFFLLDHLHGNNLISEEVFRTATRYHEAPQPRQGINTRPCARKGRGEVDEIVNNSRRRRRENRYKK